MIIIIIIIITTIYNFWKTIKLKYKLIREVVYLTQLIQGQLTELIGPQGSM